MTEESKLDDITLTEVLPIMPLRNTVVFPHQVIPLAVGREKSLNLLKYLAEESKVIGLVSQKDGNLEEPDHKDLYEWGTAAMILKNFKMPDGSEQLIVQGIYRFRVIKYSQIEPHFEATVIPAQESITQTVEVEALVNLRAEQRAKLAGYRWVAPDSGVVAVPVERAMALVAAELGAKEPLPSPTPPAGE